MSPRGLLLHFASDEKGRRSLWRGRQNAEFFGTFWLVLGGCGSAVLSAAFPDVGIGFWESLLPLG